uniref:Uncharacterized protein n=1 Tax=Culex tarsalis TaxID=7177 RepID=A0A1Q3F6F8_CULTA
MKSLVYFLVVFFTFGTIKSLERPFDAEFSQSLVEKGKKQLNELEQKSSLPRYGECWLHALDHLRDGCRTLTDSIQVDLALHFTNCFMEMSGQDRLDCVSERTEALKRLCMSEMTDRAFAVYTEFFTQTQNMCFFLQAQRWQSETDRTIDRLGVSSRDVSERLQVAGEVQRIVLEHQKEGLKLQGEMLALGTGLATALNGSQEMLDKLTEDLRNSTLEHQTVLAELFREFYLLHGWIVGRYAFVDRTIFYLTFLLAIMVATSTKRTQNSRTILLLNLLASLLIEMTLLNLLTPSADAILRDNVLWAIRKLFLAIGVLLFFYRSYRYQDANTKLLNEIKEQNRQIMDSILRLKMAAARPQNDQNSFFTTSKATAADSRSSFSLGSIVAAGSSYEERTLRKIPLAGDDATTTTHVSVLVEQDEPDYDKENSSNERRSVSRSVRSEVSEVSRASRYNLRRKTIAGQQQQ